MLKVTITAIPCPFSVEAKTLFNTLTQKLLGTLQFRKNEVTKPKARLL